MIMGETEMWRRLYHETVAQCSEALNERDRARESAVRWQQEAMMRTDEVARTRSELQACRRFADRPAHLRDGDEDR